MTAQQTDCEWGGIPPERIPCAYRCWLPNQTELGSAWTLAKSAGKARYAVARSAADAGYISRPSPHFVRCRRDPEHDQNPALEEGWCSSGHHVRLGMAAAAANRQEAPR